jgi:hypothetical protein
MVRILQLTLQNLDLEYCRHTGTSFGEECILAPGSSEIKAIFQEHPVTEGHGKRWQKAQRDDYLGQVQAGPFSGSTGATLFLALGFHMLTVFYVWSGSRSQRR